jgi:protein TonB
VKTLLPACLVLAGMAAQAQFATVPQPQPRSAALESQALTEKAYRRDAGRHLYSAYPSQVMYGVLPPLLHAVMVTDTDVDADGAVLRVRVRRAPAGAKEVTPWVVGLIRRAAPLPPPVRIGRLTYTEIWLVDKSGRFQVDALTEGQR